MLLNLTEHTDCVAGHTEDPCRGHGVILGMAIKRGCGMLPGNVPEQGECAFSLLARVGKTESVQGKDSDALTRTHQYKYNPRNRVTLQSTVQRRRTVGRSWEGV